MLFDNPDAAAYRRALAEDQSYILLLIEEDCWDATQCLRRPVKPTIPFQDLLKIPRLDGMINSLWRVLT